ncbi:hypothetical protein Cfor_08176 [Coptotermes formosanus]|uniref:Carboxylesterase type B domain-containing protein n=1 Tax=Coptotermes formosanus TaxID=36987 RepID=A0A6L2PNM0_COPFO|nr:hypothetical protein Cfor_08176 [Coptotermes formosanus]
MKGPSVSRERSYETGDYPRVTGIAPVSGTDCPVPLCTDCHRNLHRHLEPVEVFRGIPYASPPTGNLRFMPPVTGALWSGVKVADHFGPVCPQKLPDISNETLALKRMPKGRVEYLKRLLPYLQNQSEDCLYLNIYAPAQGKKP